MFSLNNISGNSIAHNIFLICELYSGLMAAGLISG